MSWGLRRGWSSGLKLCYIGRYHLGLPSLRYQKSESALPRATTSGPQKTHTLQITQNVFADSIVIKFGLYV